MADGRNCDSRIVYFEGEEARLDENNKIIREDVPDDGFDAEAFWDAIHGIRDKPKRQAN